MLRSLVPLALVAAFVACGSEVTVFGSGSTGTGVGGASSSATGSTASSSSVDVAVSSAVASSTGSSGPGSQVAVASGAGGSGGAPGTTGVGGAQVTTGSGGSGGGQCTHEACAEGDPLDGGCDKCAASVCAKDPYCCQESWDNICVSEVWAECAIDCGPPGAPACDSQYMAGTSGYQLCSQGSECSFAFNATMGSCATVCSSRGGECVAAYNDQKNVKCSLAEQWTCTGTNYQSAICMCSRGCGNGAACILPQTCKNGVCG